MASVTLSLHKAAFDGLLTQSVSYSDALDNYVHVDGPHPDKIITHTDIEGEITHLAVTDADGLRMAIFCAESEGEE